jgi:hypothetical protein
MKDRSKSPQEMGLTKENLHKSEVAMPYWLQFQSPDFMRFIVYDIRQQISLIEGWLKLVNEDPKMHSMAVESLNGMALGEICETLLKSKARIDDILGVVWEYAETTQAQSPK